MKICTASSWRQVGAWGNPVLAWHALLSAASWEVTDFPSSYIIAFWDASSQPLTIRPSLSLSPSDSLTDRPSAASAAGFTVLSHCTPSPSITRPAPPKLRYLSPSFPLLCKPSEHREQDQIWTVADPVTVLGDRRMLTFTVSSIVPFRTLQISHGVQPRRRSSPV